MLTVIVDFYIIFIIFESITSRPNRKENLLLSKFDLPMQKKHVAKLDI